MINKFTMLITGFSLFLSALVHAILAGRVEGAWTYTIISFVIFWFSYAFMLGLALASSEIE